MALGQLVVRLGLDAAEFTRGMSRAELQAQRFGQRLERGLASAGRAAAVGLQLAAAAAGAAAIGIDQLAKSAANFKDMEEKIGSSAESIASLAVAAGTAGLQMSELEAMSVRLTKGISGLDEESKSAVKALAAIGIPLKEFQALDPVAQLEAVAKALAGFADGSGKTAVAVALLGKTGAQALPFLKELAGETGRQTVLTQAQIEAADAYSDAQARATAQLKLYLQSAVIPALPAIQALTNTFGEFFRELGKANAAGQSVSTLGNLVQIFADGVVRYLGAAISTVQLTGRAFEGLAKSFIALEEAKQRALRFDFSGAKNILGQLRNDLAEIGNRPLFSAQLETSLAGQKAIAKGMALIGKENEDRMDRLARKPGINFAPSIAGAKALKEQLSDVDRFLQRMEDQQFALEFGFDEKTIADLVLLQKAIDQGLNPAKAAQFRDAIISVDSSMKRLNDARREEAALIKRVQDDSEALIQSLLDESRAIGLSESALAAYNVQLRVRDSLKDAVGLSDSVREEIIAQGKFAAALAASNVERKQADEAAKRGIASGEALVKLYQDEAGALGKVGIELELYNVGLARQAALLGVTDEVSRQNINSLFATAEAYAKVNAAQRQFVTDATQLNDAFKSSFADNIAAVADGTKSFKDAVKDMAKSWTKALNDMAAKKLGEALFGPQGSTGGGFLPDFGKLFSGLFNTGSLGKEPKTQVDPSASLATMMAASASTGSELLALTAATASSAAGFTALTTTTTSTSAALSAAATSTSAGLTALNAASTATTAPLVLLATNAGLAASALLQVSNSSALGGLFGGSDPFGIGGWALGGPMAANQPGWVGEHGKELFVPKVSGQIIPNHELSKTLGGVTNNLKIDVNVAGNTSRQSATQIATEVGIRVQRALARNT